MNEKTGTSVGYHFMLVLAVMVGLAGIALQFFAGWELLAFMLSIAALGGLIGGGSGYQENDREQLGRSYKSAFEGLLLTVMLAYAFIELSQWMNFEPAAAFINGHWPGLILAAMCLLMGLAGFRKGGAGRPVKA